MASKIFKGEANIAPEAIKDILQPFDNLYSLRNEGEFEVHNIRIVRHESKQLL